MQDWYRGNFPVSRQGHRTVERREDGGCKGRTTLKRYGLYVYDHSAPTGFRVMSFLKWRGRSLGGVPVLAFFDNRHTEGYERLVQFCDPGVDLTSPTFSQISCTIVAPRIIQFALKSDTGCARAQSA